MFNALKKYVLKFERLKGEPMPERKQIAVQQLGLATGQIVIVRRAK